MKIKFQIKKNLLGLCVFMPSVVFAQSPQANPATVVTVGNARFTVLTPEMIRIEYSDKGVFEDRATFAVQNRRMDVVPRFKKTDDGEWVYLTTDKLKLKYRKGTDPRTRPASSDNLSITMTVIGRHQQMITTPIPFAGNA